MFFCFFACLFFIVCLFSFILQRSNFFYFFLLLLLHTSSSSSSSSVAQSFPLGTLPSLSWLDTHFIELLSASLAMSTIMSLLLYVASLRLPKGHSEVAPGGDSGIAVRELFFIFLICLIFFFSFIPNF